MNNIIRFWNQNRKTVIIGIVAIVLLIILVQILNQMVREQNQSKVNRLQLTEEEKKLPTKSIIGEESTSIEVTKENVQLIEEFIEKCNNKDVSGAYQMLSDDCKDVLFKTQEAFEKTYYNIIFKEKRINNIENFLSSKKRYTYKVELYNDVLSSGDVENASSYVDYITIDENSKNGKLNINSFIYKNQINKEEEIDGIKVIVLAKQVFKDNEKYEIKIENNTNERISINVGKQNKNVYIIGSNNVNYNSYISEISSTLYEIPAKFYRNYIVRFNKVYSSGIETKAIVFSDIVKNYEKYKISPEEVKERIRINVPI